MTAHEELAKLKLSLDFSDLQDLSETEQESIRKLKKAKQPLPPDIYLSQDASYYRIVDKDLTEDEKQQLIQYRQLNYLKSIKESLTFFVVLALIGVLFGILFGFNLL